MPTPATKPKDMRKYQCGICGHTYDPAVGDPDHGIPAGTSFVDLPHDWRCPDCNASKSDFDPLDE